MFRSLDERPVAEVQNDQANAWEKDGLLKKCVEGRKDLPVYYFYEGPPTANGMPGIHHVVSRALKDSVNKYWSMKGFCVPRKAGWDTHGLPVEIEVEKALGFTTKNEIEEYGIAAFNEKCRESVFKYESVWREMTRRMGFLVDMDHPYVTLVNDYIETGWWILKKFFDAGLLYEGSRILPYCPRCGTGLASHEVSLGYKEIKTNTAIAMFRRKAKNGGNSEDVRPDVGGQDGGNTNAGETNDCNINAGNSGVGCMNTTGADAEDEYFLAWTTTPWTLVSNVALTVGPDVVYIKARQKESGRLVWCAKALADRVLGEGGYEVIEEARGSALEYMTYEQLMPFVDVYGAQGVRNSGAQSEENDDADGNFTTAKAFYITVADYATDEEGTGIVHTAPMFGDDDYNTGRKYGLPAPKPVDEEGKFTASPWKGRVVTEEKLETDIIEWLKAEGKLFKREKLEHKYPFCWRCDSALIYYSKPSWYIEMTKLKEDLIRNNNAVNWFPDFIGEKRFGNWIENVKDWAVSRTRYWGTPIPVWRCRGCGGLTCVGSREELCSRAIEDITTDIELHRPYVDDVHIKCEKCGEIMQRIPEVMDCWFDSGAMPYAQQHYPFEHKEEFYIDLFPADFICEGIDQTRGWFYSLMCISTFIEKDRERNPGERAYGDEGRASYRNCLVNDLVLDKNGVKMSKSKGNTVDPFKMFDLYGADATRWYMHYASQTWTPLRFNEEDLSEVTGKFFGTLRNVYQFFVLYANIDGIRPERVTGAAGRNEADRWLLSRLAHLVSDVRSEMDVYDHTRTVRKIQNFVIEDLSNWYIRRSRRRFWAPGGKGGAEAAADKQSVYDTTYEALITLAGLMAPFAPFISDELYLSLTGAEPYDTGASVHLSDYPVAREEDKDPVLEEKMEIVRQVVSLGRGVREKERLKVRQPLVRVLLGCVHEPLIGGMTDLILDELNVKEVVFLENAAEYINYEIKPDFKAAGPVFGKDVKALAAALAELSPAEAAELAGAVEKIKSSGFAEAADDLTKAAGDTAYADGEKAAGDTAYADGEKSDPGPHVKINVDGREFSLTADLLDIRVNAKEGYAVAMEGGVFVIVDTALTDELKQEGLAREFVSKVQQLRKQKGFDMMDRINIVYEGGPEITEAVRNWYEYITGETLADEILAMSGDNNADTSGAGAKGDVTINEKTADTSGAGAKGDVTINEKTADTSGAGALAGEIFDLNGYETKIALRKV